jgi:dipeptidyl aminopeptidase/acylaminoacyl peptidase
VYTRRTTDLEQNRGRKDLWVVDLAGGAPVRISSHPENEDAPRWLPDSRTILFLQKHAGAVQVWQTNIDGASPTQVTRFPVDVDTFTISPDGQTLAFAAEVFPECNGSDALGCTARKLERQKAKSSGSGQLYQRLFVRHWDTWKDGRRSHLFAWKLGSDADPVDLTKTLDADVPSKPFGDADEWAFSPDSRTLVFSAREAGAGEPWSTNFDLFAVPVDGGAPPTNLTPDNPAWDAGPVFSPDGTRLAYRAMRRPGYEADRFHVMQRGWPEGQAIELAAGWDRSAEELRYTADGSRLLVTAEDTGRTSLFSLDLSPGMRRTDNAPATPVTLVRDGAVHNIQRAGDRVVFLHNTMRRPDELLSVPAAGGTPTEHTAINADKLARARLGAAEQFTFVGADKDTVHAFVVQPADFDPAKKYPIAFLIHGGPQGSFGDRWSFRWNPQTYAGAGYAVVMIDFHGSTGYGQAFTDAIQDDWGGKPLQDLQLGLAAALARYPWLDGDRACALGASYGGFMVNWIASQWQSPFKCLVNHDGVFDNRMMYYATEELWFSEWEHGGPYWQKVANHERHNPVLHVDKWRLPMLVVHGGLDYRISDTQGIATFTALQRRGIPSQLLHFPDENHWVLKPANSLMWHDSVLGWLDTWLKAAE